MYYKKNVDGEKNVKWNWNFYSNNFKLRLELKIEQYNIKITNVINGSDL